MSNCRLVQIEVRDFKSFGGSHLIGPFEDFTGIVGPNGSGKSNILDSLAFVFYLDRNPRSTSYIHSVIGAVRVDDCSVRVTLEEEEEGKKKKKKVSKHTYERRYCYDQKKDSFYSIHYIDDKEVDKDEYLKKIEDKGLIPLIFVKQAEVDLIARKTPIELTQLFEEISGSKEYAKRYDELRIESESSHEAVSMIEKRRRAAISEKKHISDRKSEAAEFRKLMKKEEETQIKSSLLQLYHMNEQIKEMEYEKEVLLQKKTELESKSLDSKEDLKKIETQLGQTSGELVRIEKEYTSVEQDKRDANSNMIKYGERKTMLTEQLEDARNKLDQNVNAEKSRQDNLERYRRESERLERELKDLQPIEELEEQIQYYNNIREQASNEFDDTTQELRKAMKRQREALRAKNDIEEQLDTLKQSKEKKKDFLKQYEESKESEEKKLSVISKNIRDSEIDQRMKETQNNLDKDVLSKKTQELHEFEKKIDEIRRIEGSDKRKERFNKQLTKMTQFIPGVFGLFSELVRPTQPKYEVAAAAGCGAYKDAIIVKDSSTAIRCLEFLKEGGYGDARFLPLLNLKPVKVVTKKGVNLLSRLMNCEDIIKPAVNFVCGHIAYADDIKKAKTLAFAENITVVTLDGTIIDPRGIMTGGISRNRQKYPAEKLSTLEDKKAKLEKEIGDLGNGISKLKSELEAIEDNLLTWRPQETHRKTKIKELENRIEKTKIDIRTIKRERKKKKQELSEAEDEVKRAEDEVQQINLKIDKNDQKIFADFCKKVGVDDIKEFEINRLQDYEERYAKRLELTSKLSQYNTWISDIENQDYAETTDNYKSQIEKFQSQLDETEQLIYEANQKYQEKKEELERIKKKRDEMGVEDESNRSEAKLKRKKRQEILDKLDKNTDELNNADHEISTALSAVNSILQQCRLSNTQLPKVDGEDEEEPEMMNTPSTFTQETNNRNEITRFDYDGHLSAAERSMSHKEAKKLADQLDKSLEEIRRKIKQIRPDLKSDDRFTKVAEELDEINKGHEELREKAARTKKEFLEVKKMRRDLFMDLYEKVDQHIDKIYKELTRVRNHENRSGTAYLSLEDTEEPYLGGIKYTAMPPHKRFRDLEQLSGGEKAVASLALVIALQKFKVSPFILMDEPDASLDKLNLRAAADALTKISKNTQIVSVSLRDRFFEHSDALVGVYKDKNNQSSGILTLNLNQFVDQNLEMDALE